MFERDHRLLRFTEKFSLIWVQGTNEGGANVIFVSINVFAVEMHEG